MKKGIFFSLAAAVLGYANAEETKATGQKQLENIEKLKPFTNEWAENVQQFLKTPVHNEVKEKEEEAANMRFWTPPIPNTLDSTVQDDDTTYDVIVVGCGSSGCPFAGYFADVASDKKVLVLERGLPRAPTNTPQAMNIWGAGLTYTNPEIAQPYITQQGVRTFAASVTGGQSSINLGDFATERADFYRYMEENNGVEFDRDIWLNAVSVVRDFNGFDMPTSNLGEAASSAYTQLKIPPYETRGQSPAYSRGVQNQVHWLGQTTFLPEGDFPRDAADNFLYNVTTQAIPPNLTLKTRQTVEKIEFDTTGDVPVANCVYYHATTKFDTSKNGKSVSPIVPEATYISKPLTEAFLDPIHAFDDAERAIFGMNVLKGGRRRVCLNPGGKVVLAAGPIHTTTILYNSGVGPRQQVESLGRSVVVEHASIGQEIMDRVLIPVTTYLAQGPTEKYAGAGKISETVDPSIQRENTRPAEHVASEVNAIHDKVASSVGGVVDSSMKVGAGLAKESVQSLQNVIKNPAEALSSLLDGSTLKSRSADPTRQFKMDFSSINEMVNNGANLGPFTPGQVVGNSMFGILTPGVDPYFDVSLYQNASEFGIWPDMTVRFDYLQPGLNKPYVGEVQANTNLGTECEDVKPFTQTMTCSAASFSQFHGGRISEGFTIATRNAFPPLLRDDPLVDKMMRVLLDCSNDIVPYNNPLLLPLCEIAKPTLSCLRSQFTILTSPSTTSKGKITLFPNGLVDIKANYLSEEEDLLSAIRATSTAIDAVNTDNFDGVLQPFTSPFACPYAILNGFLDLLTSFGTITNSFAQSKNTLQLQQYLQSLIPANFRAVRRLASENGTVIEADAEKMKELGIMGKLEKFGMDTDSLAQHEMEGKTERKKLFNKKTSEVDVAEAEKERKKFMPKLFPKKEEIVQEAHTRRLEGENLQERSFMKAMAGGQRFASFPPVLPSTSQPQMVGKYAQTYMTSGNSIVNAYPLGTVVDGDFNLIGAKSLSIIDQGIYTIQPRTDAAVTNMVMGIYAAEKINQVMANSP